MAPKIQIKDGPGFRYWATEDIWAVPGPDPDGPRGLPKEGDQVFIWAHVKNVGDEPVDGARLDFYVSPPTGVLLRSTVAKLGSSFVDLAADGGEADVLCLTPWKAESGTRGYRCIVVEAKHWSSSVPKPPPNEFKATKYLEVAERNFFFAKDGRGLPAFMLTLLADPRRRRSIRLRAFQADEPLDQRLISSVGLDGFSYAANAHVDIGLSRHPVCVPPDGPLVPSDIEVDVATDADSPVFISLRATGINEGEYVPVDVLEIEDDEVTGGSTFLVGTNTR